MEELNFEKLIFGKPEEAPPKPLYLHWIVLSLVLVAVILAVFWPKGGVVPGEIYGELAPDMISWRTSDEIVTGMFYEYNYVSFTPELDPDQWDAEKITFGVKAESGLFMTNTSSANPNTLTVDSGKTATWLPEEGQSQDYVVFTAWAGEHIVGYAVVKIQPAVGDAVVGGPMYEVELLGSATFPLMDGQFQNVTEEYIQEQIDELKK